MDFLQIALIFLISLLSIFLTITGIQVFFILRDLKRALDKFNTLLQSGDNIATDIEKPISAVSTLVTSLSDKAQAMAGIIKNPSKPKPKRFYKKIL